MDYQESIAYLKGLTKFGINLGLDRIRNLLARMGNPERQGEFVHAAGTNGKGSTCAMLASIMQQSGMKVGLFTSPHLHSYTERIKINGGEIKPEEIARLLTGMRVHLDAMDRDGIEHPTEFEVSTALALDFFVREKVDLALIEVGMGGEIDSTNVITPRLAIITNVGMDHMDYLGPTVEDIARVKAGIIKDHCDVITAVDDPGALEIIRERAEKKHAPLWEEGKDFWADPVSYSLSRQVFDCTVKETVFRDLKIPLLGRHQLINAALAVAGAVKLGAGAGAIHRGLELVEWPGRLEIMGEHPLVVLDAAHNHHGVKALVDALRQYWPDRKKVLLLGMLADKEREKVATELGPWADKAVVTRPNSPRAGAWEQVADFIRPYVSQVVLEESIPKAVDTALKLAGSEMMVLITGSIYMVSEARAHLIDNCRLE